MKIVLDADGRTLIPDFSVVGCRGDKESRIVGFQIPAEPESSINLQTADFFIKYLTPDGFYGSEPVENLVNDGAAITFSWLPSSRASSKNGTIAISVCAVLPDGQDWNTSVIKLQIEQSAEMAADHGRVCCFLASAEEVKQLIKEKYGLEE